MQYYHQLVTEKSWQILQELRKKYQFILIGGWAVFLYSKSLKSKDIDIIIDYQELDKLKKEFPLSKNDRLKKYEIKLEETDIDIYLPFYSQIGLPIEEIQKHTQSYEGFILPTLEILLILKTYVYQQRKISAKGQKDLLDIFSLLKTENIDWSKYRKLISQYHLEIIRKGLKDLVQSAKPMPELNLNSQTLAKLKKKILLGIEK